MNNTLVKLSRVLAPLLIVVSLFSCTDAAFDEYIPEQSGSEGGIKYSDYIGAWEVTGDLYLDGGAIRSCTYSVSVEQKVKGHSYYLRGWSGSAVGFDFPFEMLYNSDGSVSIVANQQLGKYKIEGNGEESSIHLVMANTEQKLMPLDYKGGMSGILSNDKIDFSPSYNGFGVTYCLVEGDLAYFFAGDEYTLIRPTMKRLPQTPAYYENRSVITLQEHSVGEGINLYIVGDGYTAEYDFGVDGKFINDAKGCMEAFFEVEPMKSLRDYFGVYVIASHSKERGVSSGYSSLKRNTLFEVSLTDILSSSNIGVNYDKVHSFVYDVVDNPGIRGYNVILVMANQDESAGTAYLNSSTNHSNVAVVPITSKQDGYEAIVRHEAVGHAFGLLMDEYIYYGTEIPAAEKSDILESMSYGFGANLTFNSRQTAHWAKYYNLPGYEMVGYFEGGLKYQYGVWRSEEFSCMDNNVPYFTAPSREKLYSRVMERSGIPFDFDEYLEYDAINLNQSRTNEWGDGVRLTDDLIILKNFSE